MATPADHLIRRHRYSVDDYYCMAAAGVLRPDERVELIDGEIIDMTPIGSRHAAVVTMLNQRLISVLGTAAIVSVQNPVWLGTHSEPQPDIALLKPRSDFYEAAHPSPGDVLVIIEVADSSAAYDRDVKLPLYARHGIPGVWLVDLATQKLTVYGAPADGTYTTVTTAEDLTRMPIPGLPDTNVDLGPLLQ